jgi:hypothetical protein
MLLFVLLIIFPNGDLIIYAKCLLCLILHLEMAITLERRIYNGLPNKLKIILNNSNKFKASIKEFLHLNSYYTLD